MSVSAATVERPSRGAAISQRLGLDRFELATLVALSGLSLAVLAGLLVKDRPLSGADGLLAADQLQYFAWIRDAAHHWLIGNRFGMVAQHRVFLHPGFLASGLLHDVTGLSIPASYLLWKPLAIALTFAGCLLYVRRLVPAGRRRHVALLVALFAAMPASAFVAWTGWGGKPRQFTFDFIAGELWSGQYLWGYFMTSIGVFLMPLVLLAVERWRRERRPATLAWAAAGSLLICWLQPWQGATVALIVVAVEAWRWLRTREPPAWALAAIPAAVAVPAIYYGVLGRSDPAWKLAAKANAAGAQPTWHWPWWAVVLTLLPLAAPAALAYRGRAAGWQETAVRAWPFAALAVYLAPVGTFPYHAFQGLALPLGILAVLGVTRFWPHPRPALVLAALFVLIVPGVAHRVQVAYNSVHTAGSPYWVFAGEVDALKSLEADRRPGGVLAPVYAGYMVPARTGRETYVGALSWTPDWARRVRAADALFEGRLRGAAARAFVLSTHARFLFEDCRPHLVDLTAELRPLLESARRFGCATVWTLRLRPGMTRAGPPDA
jgi:hypothetical protein